jgi:hypothetical protein
VVGAVGDKEDDLKVGVVGDKEDDLEDEDESNNDD